MNDFKISLILYAKLVIHSILVLTNQNVTIGISDMHIEFCYGQSL